MKRAPVPCLFVVGTGTGVGKTAVAALFLEALRGMDLDVAASKPLASGCRRVRGRLISDDAIRLARALGLRGARLQAAHDVITPWRARPPLAPALALPHAPTLAELVAHVEARAQGQDALVVEGAGGLLVPYAADGTVLDLLTLLRRRRSLAVHVVLVGASSLGTINHTCLSIRALQAAGAPPSVVLLSRTRGARTPDERDNANAIARLAGVARPVTIPFVMNAKTANAAHRIVRAVARQLLAATRRAPRRQDR